MNAYHLSYSLAQVDAEDSLSHTQGHLDCRCRWKNKHHTQDTFREAGGEAGSHAPGKLRRIGGEVPAMHPQGATAD